MNQALYQTAIEIGRYKPWLKLMDYHLIKISIEDKDYYCSFIGQDNICLALNIYQGLEGIFGFYDFSNTDDNFPPKQLARYNNCTTIYFDESKDVLNKEYYQSLKLKQDDYYPSIKVNTPKYTPSNPNPSQELLLLSILDKLKHVLYLIKNNNHLDLLFDNRIYTYDNDKLSIEIMDLEPLAITYDYHLTSEEENKLLNAKVTDTTLELDTAYLNIEVALPEDNREANLCLAICIDSETGFAYKVEVLQPHQDYYHELIKILVEHIIQHGLPKEIVVRDRYILGALQFLKEYATIEMYIDVELDEVDYFVEQFIEAQFKKGMNHN